MEQYNPFAALFNEIAAMRSDIKEMREAGVQSQSAQTPDEFIPVSDVVGKYIGRTTFYAGVKDGTFQVYKMGNKSFVKPSEFFSAFKPLGKGNPSKNTGGAN